MPPHPAVLYVCIPVHNEAATVGVLLWRVRTVLQEAGGGRDYEVVVYDDASTDATAEVLAPYARVLPLTVLGGPGAAPRGRTAATAGLLRHVASHSRYPRRDACVVLQGDFTERAEDLPALLAAFDGGADVVVARRPPDPAQPPAERRLRRLAPWVLRPLVRVDGVDDLLAGPRLLRVSVVRDLARARGDRALLDWPGWAGVAELVAAAVPHARRVAVVDAAGRYDVRPRASRLDWAGELRTIARYAWQARGTRAQPQAARAAERPAAAPPPAEAPADATPNATPLGDAEPARAPRPRRKKRRPAAEPAPPAGTSPNAAEAVVDARPAQPPAAPERAEASEHGDGEAAPARRRKRRPRRKGRGAEAGDAATAPGEATDDTAGADAPPPTRPPTADALEAADARDEGDPATDEPATDSSAADEPGAGRAKRRRRRRGRARSADGSGGVEVGTAEPPPPDAFQADGPVPPPARPAPASADSHHPS